ncbi:MAG: helix-turn-helix domain-containing protein, partial [Bacteroidota bacterium]
HPDIAHWVAYYYLDRRPGNIHTRFTCFPHTNNCLSLYRSHRLTSLHHMHWQANGQPMQIFTPVRTQTLTVRQTGPVHRIVIVFKLLGAQQFCTTSSLNYFQPGISFFTPTELKALFAQNSIREIADLLDSYLLKRYQRKEVPALEGSLSLLQKEPALHSIAEIAEQAHVSRRHLNRLVQQHLGLPAKRLQQIFRFRQILAQKPTLQAGDSFTGLAHTLAFADQSHLNKLFTSLADRAPRAFFQEGTLLGQEDIYWRLEQWEGAN